MENYGDGREVTTSGFCNLNGSGRSHGDSQNGSGTVMKQWCGQGLVHMLCHMQGDVLCPYLKLIAAVLIADL